MTPWSRHPQDVASMRGLLTSLAFDIKLLRLRQAFQRKHWSEQPRAPAGQPIGGQWAPLSDGTNAEQAATEDNTRIRSNYQKLAETCQEYIAANCRAKIHREFPKQFLDWDVSDLKAAAQANEPGAKRAYNLFFDNRFPKQESKHVKIINLRHAIYLGKGQIAFCY